MAITNEERDSIHSLVEESKETVEIAKKISEHLRGSSNGHNHGAERIKSLLVEEHALVGVETGT